jgi:hypothetical protein
MEPRGTPNTAAKEQAIKDAKPLHGASAKTLHGAKQPQSMREVALSTLADIYLDATLLTTETWRAIQSFKGTIPPDSPYRYLRMSVGDAIVCYLTRLGRPRTVAELSRELQDGHCIFGAIKPPIESVNKSVKAYVQGGHLAWMDKGKTLVGLPAWKKKRKIG